MKIKNLAKPITQYAPLDHCIEGWSTQEIEIGKQVVKEGRACVVVLAGGQGSRLNAKGSKGSICITPFAKKSLFQVIAEKVLAASQLVDRPLSLAFMTSKHNHEEVVNFFCAHNFFGLQSAQLAFFPQDELPLLDENEQPFEVAPGEPALGPNGNGSIFEQMVKSGLWKRWKSEGIELVQVLPIDNILATPFHFGLLGVHKKVGCDVTLAVSRKKEVDEKLGNVVIAENKVRIIEYSEFPQEKKEALDASGNFVYKYLNLGLLTFSLPFIARVGELPYHIAKKASARYRNGKIEPPLVPFAHKYEQFIFDSFLYAESVQAIHVKRADCYAPLKNLTGDDSIASVQAALQRRDRIAFEEVTGIAPPENARFELSQEFYYPTEEFQKKWRGKELPKEGYIG
ncbi:MAG: UTP--glucose-1-phosphate uridylyltransferase [Chlamydiales bacterium]|nr:UTP--glucose-1-phosphate uridylyltransferase [Chlamydiales bacterium]